MKRSYVALIVYSLLIDAYTIDKIYEDLARNAGFQGLSPLEIAIERKDIEAIRHFAIDADRMSIVRAIDQLKKEIDFAYQDLENLNRVEVYNLGAVALEQKKTKILKRVQELKTIIDTLTFQLK